MYPCNLKYIHIYLYIIFCYIQSEIHQVISCTCISLVPLIQLPNLSAASEAWKRDTEYPPRPTTHASSQQVHHMLELIQFVGLFNSSPKSCDIYTGNSIPGSLFALAFGLAIGISYLPQVVKIARLRSTEGINPYFLMLMTLGSSFAFSNILVLSKPVVHCCLSGIGLFDCGSSLLGAFQLFAGLLGPLILVALSVRFRESGSKGDAMIRSAKIVLMTLLVSWFFVVIITDPLTNRRLATLFGLLALGVGFVQYFPQLYTTYKLKHTGSLSIIMMLVQIPGGYMFGLSLMMRKDSHWSTWISVMAAASFQLTLLIMALYYSIKKTSEVGDRITSPAPSETPITYTDSA